MLRKINQPCSLGKIVKGRAWSKYMLMKYTPYNTKTVHLSSSESKWRWTINQKSFAFKATITEERYNNTLCWEFFRNLLSSTSNLTLITKPEVTPVQMPIHRVPNSKREKKMLPLISMLEQEYLSRWMIRHHGVPTFSVGNHHPSFEFARNRSNGQYVKCQHWINNYINSTKQRVFPLLILKMVSPFYRHDQLSFTLLWEHEFRNTSTDGTNERKYAVYMVRNTKWCIQQGKEYNCHFTSTAVLQCTAASDTESWCKWQRLGGGGHFFNRTAKINSNRSCLRRVV